ncbi:MAG TPA: GntR family transcriptional regulator [Microbacteriaceae bacterium]|nr:GntR family transcriptional regulator [Microbacteriaceae bacterium]
MRSIAEENAVLPGTLHVALRDAVLDRELPPGTAVTESAVASRYGVARPTARLAIERLVAEGLLARAPHQSARVPVLSAQDIADIFDSRALVEQAAIERLARAGSIPAEALAAHRELLAIDDRAPFARLDATFHRSLVAGQPNARLARMHGLLMGEIELCIAQVQAERVLTPVEIGAQHQAILDAVTAGDATLAGRLARDHIHGARDRLLAAAQATTDPTQGLD